MNDIWDYVRVYNLMDHKFCRNLIHQYENDDQWRKHFWYSHGERSQYEDKELDVRFSTASAELDPYINSTKRTQKKHGQERLRERDSSPDRMSTSVEEKLAAAAPTAADATAESTTIIRSSSSVLALAPPKGC